MLVIFLVLSVGWRGVRPTLAHFQVLNSAHRYEYEVFSGTATSSSSESLVDEQGGWLAALARRAGILRRPVTGAVHTLVVQTPSGQQRTFRWVCSSRGVIPGGVSRACSAPRSLLNVVQWAGVRWSVPHCPAQDVLGCPAGLALPQLMSRQS